MTQETNVGWSDEEVAAAVRQNALWYHTIELRPGVVTPGWFDLRPVVGRFPWPDVRGKRCLDIGTYDGFLAFEMERRGAAEVVATDIRGHEDWDFPPAVRAGGVDYLKTFAGEKGRGFEIAKKALGSSVRKVIINVYDLSPEELGTFDVVVCGALLLHLRDPFRALAAIRSVCKEYFLSAEQIEAGLSVMHPRRPLTSLANANIVQWHVANVAGHREMLKVAGFDIVQTPRPYPQLFGVSHPPRRHSFVMRAATRLVTGGDGVPHAAVLARRADLGSTVPDLGR